MLNSVNNILEYLKTHFNEYLKVVKEEEQDTDTQEIEVFKVKYFETLQDGYTIPFLYAWCNSRTTNYYSTTETISLSIVANGVDEEALAYRLSIYLDTLERCIRGDKSFGDTINHPSEFTFNNYIVGGVGVITCTFTTTTYVGDWEK